VRRRGQSVRQARVSCDGIWCSRKKKDQKKFGAEHPDTTYIPVMQANRNMPPWQVHISASTGKPYWHNPETTKSTWMCPVQEPEREHANTGQKPKNKVLAPAQAPEARSAARVQRGGGKQEGFGDLAEGNLGGFSVSSFATKQMLKMGFVVGKVCEWICVLIGGGRVIEVVFHHRFEDPGTTTHAH